jgi:hypothetical protein
MKDAVLFLEKFQETLRVPVSQHGGLSGGALVSVRSLWGTVIHS